MYVTIPLYVYGFQRNGNTFKTHFHPNKVFQGTEIHTCMKIQSGRWMFEGKIVMGMLYLQARPALKYVMFIYMSKTGAHLEKQDTQSKSSLVLQNVCSSRASYSALSEKFLVWYWLRTTTVLLFVSLFPGQRPIQIASIKSLAECKLQNLNISKWICFLIHTSENTDYRFCSLKNGEQR